MPFKSAKQREFLFANHPDVAKKFAADTPKQPHPMNAFGHQPNPNHMKSMHIKKFHSPWMGMATANSDMKEGV